MWRPLLLTLLASSTVFADALHTCEHCAKNLLPSVTQIRPGRKYARDRRVDIQHLKLDVTPDFSRRIVAGSMSMSFKPIALPLDKLELDAVDLDIQDISVTGARLADRIVEEDKLILVFDHAIVPGTDVSVNIRYQVEPQRGLYFRTPEMGYKAGDSQLWTQGEADLHRFWFPCYDYPNERFTSEVICHAPKGMEVVSNGHLVSKKETEAGLVTWHWLQDKPHVNYLIALAVGHFYKLEAKAGNLPLALLVPPSHKEQAANAFADTQAIIDFYQKEIGLPFPWVKYYQVYCHDFIAGGMENTSCTFQAAGLLFNQDTEKLRSLHWLDAHETAHQWFGDLVTCRDWSHLWLNEGFASYYTILYEQAKNGDDAMKYALWQEAEEVIEAKDTRPTVWRDYGDPMQQFDTRVYPKGAWILHMLRSQLGPDLYRQAIKAYLEKHQNGIVSTDDLHEVLEEVSGLSFDAFFDQWLYHGAFPELKVDYAWDAASGQAKLTVKQAQKVTDQVRLFRIPLTVGFSLKGSQQMERRTIQVTEAEENFYFALPSQPELVRVDPDYALLGKIEFTPPGAMLDKQLQGDMVGRMLAARILGSRKDQASVDKLARLLKEDSFHSVRSEAARALAKMATPAARDVLLASLAAGQPDSRARQTLVESVAALPWPECQEALLEHSTTEKNPLILATIIKSWGSRPGNAEVSAALARHLSLKSFQEQVATAAIAAYRAQDDATAVPAILQRLQDQPLEFRTRDYASALDSLAFLARKEQDREKVRIFLTGFLTHPKEELRAAAAKSLGTLKDPKAIAVLQAMIPGAGPFADPVREAAAKAVQTLQNEQPGSVELKSLWSQVQELQKKAEALQKQVDEADKKAAALNPQNKPSAPPSKQN